MPLERAPEAEGRPCGTSPDSPIQLVSHTLLSRNQVFSIHFDHIRDNHGNGVSNYLSVIPLHTVGSLTGVCILPVIGEKIGLIQVYRHPLARWSLEAPKGFIDKNEAPAAAALRELIEETGLAVSENHLCYLGSVAPEAGVIEGMVGMFYADLRNEKVENVLSK